MKFMKESKIRCIALIALMGVVLCGCEKNNTYDEYSSMETAAPSEMGGMFSFEGTVFQYGGNQYEMTEREGMINAVVDCATVGDFLIVQGHTGPENSVYSVFDTQTQIFERDLIGTNIIWHDEDVKTILYSFWSEILNYDGGVVGSVEMEADEYIRGVRFMNHYSEVEVEITGDAQDSRMETLKIQ